MPGGGYLRPFILTHVEDLFRTILAQVASTGPNGQLVDAEGRLILSKPTKKPPKSLRIQVERMDKPYDDGAVPIYISDSKHRMKAVLSAECIRRFEAAPTQQEVRFGAMCRAFMHVSVHQLVVTWPANARKPNVFILIDDWTHHSGMWPDPLVNADTLQDISTDAMLNAAISQLGGILGRGRNEEKVPPAVAPHQSEAPLPQERQLAPIVHPPSILQSNQGVNVDTPDGQPNDVMDDILTDGRHVLWGDFTGRDADFAKIESGNALMRNYTAPGRLEGVTLNPPKLPLRGSNNPSPINSPAPRQEQQPSSRNSPKYSSPARQFVIEPLSFNRHRPSHQEKPAALPLKVVENEEESGYLGVIENEYDVIEEVENIVEDMDAEQNERNQQNIDRLVESPSTSQIQVNRVEAQNRGVAHSGPHQNQVFGDQSDNHPECAFPSIVLQDGLEHVVEELTVNAGPAHDTVPLGSIPGEQGIHNNSTVQAMEAHLSNCSQHESYVENLDANQVKYQNNATPGNNTQSTHQPVQPTSPPQRSSATPTLEALSLLHNDDSPYTKWHKTFNGPPNTALLSPYYVSPRPKSRQSVSVIKLHEGPMNQISSSQHHVETDPIGRSTCLQNFDNPERQLSEAGEHVSNVPNNDCQPLDFLYIEHASDSAISDANLAPKSSLEDTAACTLHENNDDSKDETTDSSPDHHGHERAMLEVQTVIAASHTTDEFLAIAEGVCQATKDLVVDGEIHVAEIYGGQDVVSTRNNGIMIDGKVKATLKAHVESGAERNETQLSLGTIPDKSPPPSQVPRLQMSPGEPASSDSHGHSPAFNVKLTNQSMIGNSISALVFHNNMKMPVTPLLPSPIMRKLGEFIETPSPLARRILAPPSRSVTRSKQHRADSSNQGDIPSSPAVVSRVPTTIIPAMIDDPAEKLSPCIENQQDQPVDTIAKTSIQKLVEEDAGIVTVEPTDLSDVEPAQSSENIEENNTTSTALGSPILAPAFQHFPSQLPPTREALAKDFLNEDSLPLPSLQFDDEDFDLPAPKQTDSNTRQTFVHEMLPHEIMVDSDNRTVGEGRFHIITQSISNIHSNMDTSPLLMKTAAVKSPTQSIFLATQAATGESPLALSDDDLAPHNLVMWKDIIKREYRNANKGSSKLRPHLGRINEAIIEYIGSKGGKHAAVRCQLPHPKTKDMIAAVPKGLIDDTFYLWFENFAKSGVVPGWDLGLRGALPVDDPEISSGEDTPIKRKRSVFERELEMRRISLSEMGSNNESLTRKKANHPMHSHANKALDKKGDVKRESPAFEPVVKNQSFKPPLIKSSLLTDTPEDAVLPDEPQPSKESVSRRLGARPLVMKRDASPVSQSSKHKHQNGQVLLHSALPLPAKPTAKKSSSLVSEQESSFWGDSNESDKLTNQAESLTSGSISSNNNKRKIDAHNSSIPVAGKSQQKVRKLKKMTGDSVVVEDKNEVIDLTSSPPPLPVKSTLPLTKPSRDTGKSVVRSMNSHGLKTDALGRVKSKNEEPVQKPPSHVEPKTHRYQPYPPPLGQV
ncbi:hypothetical protein SeLEV6574_g00912 [Synchytrium endobioticum]|uniref:Uncharacterized protein n=1 Tax=Synchytrium endobioticum TaxID=286115 RepID=A0A507DGE5_9FUNG|nr:hypothetical protein SeLEV6574_g00912 [Synchytrium endobioticum]